MTHRAQVHVTWGDDFQSHIGLHLLVVDLDGKRLRVKDFIMEETTAVTLHEPVAFVSRDDAQWLLDRLWGLGLRPSNDATPDQLKAMDNHLQDMRMYTQQLLNYVLIEKSNLGKDEK